MNNMMDGASIEAGAQTSTQEPTMSSLLALLVTGTGAIDPETVAPPDDTERPEEVTLLGVASDDMRRLFGFHCQVVREANVLASEARGIVRDLLGSNSRAQALLISAEWFLNLMNGEGGRREKALRLQDIELELRTKYPLMTLTGDIFEAEIRRQFPMPAGHNVCRVYCDWSIGSKQMGESETGCALPRGSASMFGEGFLSPFGLNRGEMPDLEMFSGDETVEDLFRRLSKHSTRH